MAGAVCHVEGAEAGVECGVVSLLLLWRELFAKKRGLQFIMNLQEINVNPQEQNQSWKNCVICLCWYALVCVVV